MPEAITRTLPSSDAGSSLPYDAVAWQNKANAEIGGLWARVNYRLESIGGTGNAVTGNTDFSATLSLTALTAGMGFWFISTAGNTGAMTLAIDGLAAKDIVDEEGNALISGMVPSGALVRLIYDGTKLRLQTIGSLDTTYSGLARFWVKAGVTGNILASFNVTSVTDTGAGVLTVTIATDFSSAHWVGHVSIENNDATIDQVSDGSACMIANGTQTAGSVQLLNKLENATAAADPTTWHVSGYGVQ